MFQSAVMLAPPFSSRTLLFTFWLTLLFVGEGTTPEEARTAAKPGLGVTTLVGYATWLDESGTPVGTVSHSCIQSALNVTLTSSLGTKISLVCAPYRS